MVAEERRGESRGLCGLCWGAGEPISCAPWVRTLVPGFPRDKGSVLERGGLWEGPEYGKIIFTFQVPLEDTNFYIVLIMQYLQLKLNVFFFCLLVYHVSPLGT